MPKIFGFTCASFFFLLFVTPQISRFSQYKPVEAYEIRPGILMMPRYSNDGQVCEIGLQTRNYSPEIIRLDSKLSREEIDRIFDDLVPRNERGPKSKGLEGDLTTVVGPGMSESIDFENVSIEIDSRIRSSSHPLVVEDPVAAVARWKNRKCE
jgi:hypothetical protein